MSALNYVETVEYSYGMYSVEPDTSYDTIAHYQGTWTVRILRCEWCSAAYIQQLLASYLGWVVEMGQPEKVSEEVDLLNVVITAKKRTS